MLVATTRRAAADPAELYSGERGGQLSFANIVVSIPPDSARAAGEVKWPSAPPGNPATDFVVTKASLLDAKATRSWLDSHGSVARGIRRWSLSTATIIASATPFFASRSSCTIPTPA
jgi:esterase/lipase superfamily enzyme